MNKNLPDWLQNEFWETRDKKILFAKDFNDVHLISTINFIEARFAPIRQPIESLEGLLLVRLLEHADEGTVSSALHELDVRGKRTLRQYLIDESPIYCNLYNEAVFRQLM